jgi:hypothetical protein
MTVLVDLLVLPRRIGHLTSAIRVLPGLFVLLYSVARAKVCNGCESRYFHHAKVRFSLIVLKKAG